MYALGIYTYKHIYLIRVKISYYTVVLSHGKLVHDWNIADTYNSKYPVKICLLEITDAQKTHLWSLIDLQIPRRSVRTLNGQTTGFCARHYLSNISMSPDILYYHYLL